MAAAVEVRWPNEKDQYELQEVIGKIIMVIFKLNYTAFSRYKFSVQGMVRQLLFKLQSASLAMSVLL